MRVDVKKLFEALNYLHDVGQVYYERAVPRRCVNDMELPHFLHAINTMRI